MNPNKWIYYEPHQLYYSIKRCGDGNFIVAVCPFGNYKLVKHVAEIPSEVIEYLKQRPEEAWKLERVLSNKK